jgi:hypothetical protein
LNNDGAHLSTLSARDEPRAADGNGIIWASC